MNKENELNELYEIIMMYYGSMEKYIEWIEHNLTGEAYNKNISLMGELARWKALEGVKG